MILVDLSQIMIANLMVNYYHSSNEVKSFDVDMCRHMVLNSLRAYRVKFNQHHGYTSLVVAVDSRDRSWRKALVPDYKANRKEDKEKSQLDWDNIHSIIRGITDEIKDHLPFLTVEVPNAEGDDVIACLAERHHKTERIVIVSGDKDFIQLKRYDGVDIYHPIKKEYVEATNLGALQYLKQHIIKGDKADNIPNILSPMNTFLTPGARQKPLRKTLIDKLIKAHPDSFDSIKEFNDPELVKERYRENRQLIDFTMIPDELREKIHQQLKLEEKRVYYTSREELEYSLVKYLKLHKLNSLLDKKDDFFRKTSG